MRSTCALILGLMILCVSYHAAWGVRLMEGPTLTPAQPQYNEKKTAPPTPPQREMAKTTPKPTPPPITSPPAGERSDRIAPAESGTPESSRAEAEETGGEETGEGETAPEEEEIAETGYISLDFQGIDIQEFIKFAASLTGKDHIIPNDVTGKLTIIAPRKMTLSEAIQAFECVLEVNGYSVVINDQTIKVLKTPAAVTHEIEVTDDPMIPMEDRLVTQIFPLKFTKANDIQNLIATFLPKDKAQMVTDPRNNLLIIADTRSNLKRIQIVLHAVDVPEAVPTLKIVPLKCASASDLSTKLVQILAARGLTGRKTDLKASTSGRREPIIIPYERTNALIVLAGTLDMGPIEDLIHVLDIFPPPGKGTLHVYYLQHAKAEDTAKILSEMPISRSDDGTDPSGGSIASGTSALQNQTFKVSPDKDTNALVIFADASTYNALTKTIQTLDIPRKQVLVEMAIMEVSSDKQFKVGVEWSAFEDFTYDQGKRTGGIFARTGLNSAASLADLPTGPLVGVIGESITIHKGSTEITLPNVTAFLNAMAKDTDIKIISKPRIMTMDSQEAQITVGQNRPYLTKSDTDATDSSRTVQTYDYRDIGMKLKLTPSINQKGDVCLTLSQEISALLPGQGEDAYAPTTLKRSTQTVVTVKSGTTMAIACLKGESLTTGDSRVPLLGDIPVLGQLFKTQTQKGDTTDLYIFITPTVIALDDNDMALSHKKSPMANIP